MVVVYITGSERCFFRILFYFGLNFQFFDGMRVSIVAMGLIFKKETILNDGCTCALFPKEMTPQIQFPFILIILYINVSC